MNTHEMICYRNQLRDYLSSDEGKRLSPDWREKIYAEIDQVNYRINSMMGEYNTNENIIQNFNPENEI